MASETKMSTLLCWMFERGAAMLLHYRAPETVMFVIHFFIPKCLLQCSVCDTVTHFVKAQTQ